MSMTLVAPHEDVLFKSSEDNGTYYRNVKLSADVGNYDAIRIAMSKVDGSDWNVSVSESPVITRNGKRGAHISMVCSQLVEATTQVVTASILVEGTRILFGSSFWLNRSQSGGQFSTGAEPNFNTYHVFYVIGIRYQ